MVYTLSPDLSLALGFSLRIASNSSEVDLGTKKTDKIQQTMTHVNDINSDRNIES
jgi:hypothetical protein